MIELNTKWLLLGNLIITGYLTGLIWTIQVVHYPSFAKFSPEDFLAFHHFHTSRITLIVALPMVLELSLAGVLLMNNPSALLGLWLNVFLFGLVLLLWASTFFWAIPLHNRLEQSFDAGIIEQLVGMNWLRTLAWTLRFGILAWLVGRLL